MPLRRPLKICSFIGLLAICYGLFQVPVGAEQPLGSHFGPRFVYESWAVESGLPQVTVNTVAQDSIGYLWVGTEEGLGRFDGLQFKVLNRRNSPELRSNSIRRIVADTNADVLWVATRGGLSRLEDGRITKTFTAADGLPSDDIRSLAVGDDGLWVGAVGGVVQKRGNRFEMVFDADIGLPRALLEARDGSLWVGSTQGLYQLEGGEQRRLGSVDGLPDDDVFAVFESSGGGLWIGTVGGLARYENETVTIYSAADGLVHPTVNAIFEDRGGMLWFGTEGGLNRLEDRELPFLTTDAAFPRRRASAFFEDDEGSLWLGTGEIGLARLRPARVESLTPLNGFPHKLVWVLLEDRRGDIYIGTNAGLHRFDGTQVFEIPGLEVLRDRDIRSLYEDRHGVLWAGTSVDGLGRLREGRFELVYTAGNGLGRGRVWQLLEDETGVLWVATSSGLGRLEDGVIRLLSSADGLPSDETTSLALAKPPGSGLWVGTAAGLARVTDTVRAIAPDDLEGVTIKAIYPDDVGDVWLGTAEDGLILLSGDAPPVRLGEDQGLPDQLFHQVLEDDLGRLWLSSNRGLFAIAKSELKAVAAGQRPTVTTLVLGAEDGMPSSELNGQGHPAGIRARDGRFWWPTVNGIGIVNPKNLATNPVPPRIHIEEVIVDQESIPLGLPGDLPPGAKVFDFRFAAVSYVRPEGIRYRYRLVGFDEEWKDVGATERLAHYTNLDAGLYTFRVQARNSDGVWNEDGAAFQFRIQQSFFKTWYFYLGCLVMAVMVARLLHTFRIRKLVSRNQELLDMKAALEAKNEEVERMNAEIKSKNAELEQFAYTVSHDLKSPLFTIRGFIGLMEVAVQAGKYDQLVEDIGRVRSAAAHMQDLLDELLELARIGRVVNPPEHIALQDILDEVTEQNAGLLNEKNVRVEIESEMPNLYGDRIRLIQVFMNLIRNAANYTGEQSEPVIRIRARTRQDRVVIRVQDNGAGIPADYHEKIFGLFERLDTKTAGTGVGLALVKRIVEFHGGTIHVESEGPGHGSTFVVALPAAAMS